MLQTAIAMIVFNRPETTKRVFAQVAQAKPKRLFVIADGPRPGRPDDIERCEAVRRDTEQVNWDCEVVRDYVETNLGLSRRVISGINLAFREVEELIVLEDDCVPDITFFPFCEQLLEKYRHDTRVMHIAGNHFQKETRRPAPHSYSFSRWNIAWGWATWRRAWQHFDLQVRHWPELQSTDFLDQIMGDPRAVALYRGIFDQLYEHPSEVAWDHAWSFACWKENGFSILPDTTLVSNVGFGPDATNTLSLTDPRAQLRKGAMAFPLKHPAHFLPDRVLDEFIVQTYVVPSVQKRTTLARRIYGAVRQGATVLPPPVRRAVKRMLSTVRSVGMV